MRPAFFAFLHRVFVASVTPGSYITTPDSANYLCAPDGSRFYI